MRSPIVVLVLVAAACGPNVETGDAAEDTTTDTGERPTLAGSMYSPCAGVEDCAPLEFCVFPPGEDGYCSAACEISGEPGTCDPSPGGNAQVDCLDIGLADDRLVCTLDCADGRKCPGGMRCEAIESPSGRRDVCF